MTISSEARKAGPFIGNGVTTIFPFTFKVFGIGEVLVVRTGLDDVESTLSMITDYTVTLNGNQDASPGGTISIPIAPATGVKITITSRVANLQSLDLTNQGGFYPNVINKALDRLTILVQQLAEKVGRAITMPISGSTTPAQFASSLLSAKDVAESAAGAALGYASVATSMAGSSTSSASAAAASASSASASAASFTSRTITELADVDTTGASTGNALVFNGTDWVANRLNLSSGNAVSGILPCNRGGNGAMVDLSGEHLPLVVFNNAGTAICIPQPITSVAIDDAVVTYAKIQNVSATNRLLGRASAGAGVVEEITCTAAGRALIDDADAAAQRATLSAPEITSGSWSPSSYTGFSSNPSITFNWEKIGNTVTVRVGSATDGTSNAATFIASGNMPAAITPAGNRSVMIPVRVTALFAGVTHQIATFVGILQISSSGYMSFSVPFDVGDGTSRSAAGQNLGAGQDSSTSGGSNAKGLVVGSCFTYLL